MKSLDRFSITQAALESIATHKMKAEAHGLAPHVDIIAP